MKSDLDGWPRRQSAKGVATKPKSMIGSGFLVVVQFIIFLFVGYLLSEFYLDKNIEFTKDREFAYFIMKDLPFGIKGILIAGVLSAAMSTLSSSINAFWDLLIHFTRNTIKNTPNWLREFIEILGECVSGPQMVADEPGRLAGPAWLAGLHGPPACQPDN